MVGTSVAKRLAALLDRKLPGARTKPSAERRRMPRPLAALYAHVGAGTVLGPFGAAVLSAAVATGLKAAYRIPGWHPFVADEDGVSAVFVVDDGSPRAGRVMLFEKGMPFHEIARSAEAYLEIVVRALTTLPDPPGPDEDDDIEEEQRERFDAALRKRIAASAKEMPPPFAGVPTPPPRRRSPQKNESLPRAACLFASFTLAPRYDLVSPHMHVGKIFGAFRLKSYDLRGPTRCMKLVRSPRKVGVGPLFVLLDPKTKEACATWDPFDGDDSMLPDLFTALRKTGIRIKPIAIARVGEKQRARWDAIVAAGDALRAL